MTYNVTGGVWTDTTWKKLTPGTEENYGPFDTYDEAVKKWRERHWANVDDCHHRVFIIRNS